MNILSLLNFFNNKSGATAIEYGIVAALISLGTVASVRATGENLEDTFYCIAGAIAGTGCIVSGDVISFTDFNNINVEDHSGQWETFEDGQELANGWYVEDGTTDIHDGDALNWYDDGTANHVDLDGDTPGAISKDLETTSGRTYLVKFDYAKHPGAENLIREFIVSGADASATFTAETVGGWDNGTFEFTATSDNTKLSFTSSSENGSLGTLLDNIEISVK